MGIIRWVRRAVILSVIVFLVTAGLVIASAIWMDRKHGLKAGFDTPLDVVLVLSGGIDPDHVLSFSTRRRVHGAVWLLKQGHTKRVILSGGRIKPKRPIIAEKMRELALEMGADPATLIVERNSRTTWENLRFSYDLIDTETDTRVGLLTDPSHLVRAQVLNAYLDGPQIVLIAAPAQFLTSRPVQAVEFSREALAWWYNLGKIVAWEGLGWIGFSDDERGSLIY